MSLFKKPKKTMQRRVFSAMDEDQDDKMEVDEMPPIKEKKRDKNHDKDKIKPTKASLLSFGDEEEDSEEVFQVKKSSHSKKIIKKLDKERKKKTPHHNTASSAANDRLDKESNFNNNFNSNSDNSVKKENTDKKSHLIQKEIRTGDFVLVVKNSEPSNLVLNGRAALCAGRDDMSSEEEENLVEKKRTGNHKFSQPANLSFALESGAIPDAAMIHEARKRRQKAREQGDLIPVEEPEDPKKGKRQVREEDAEEGGTDEDEERIDMVNVTGVKEREERREKFYSVQQEFASDDSDMETNEWENHQIRKGVTGAQLISAQQESIYSQYMIQPFSFSSNTNGDKPPLTTAELLEQAYSHINYEVTKHEKKQKAQESKATGLKTPQEILQALQVKLKTSKELNSKHFEEIERISTEMNAIELDLSDCVTSAPAAAAKYRFYQELKHYVGDLVECLDEKTPEINALEDKALALMGKNSKRLIERRRQDVRDQAKEVMDTKTSKKSTDDEERVRRAAEREGRRTRRRRDREKFNLTDHNDGMSSDDEIPDLEAQQYKAQLTQLKNEATLLFEDVEEDYCEISHVKKKFEDWKQKELNSYKEAFVNLCLPKIFGSVIRSKLILWNPFDENYEDVEKTGWFHQLAMYGKKEAETEESLRNDPDLFLIPTVIEKILLPKLTKLIEEMWDPLSTTQTLKLVGLVKRLSTEFPSLRITSKSLHVMFTAMLDKMKVALDNDVFIPIFQKQTQDAKTAFFQRQFYSGVKLFRNFLSFQGIISDTALKDLAISSLLNRYLLSGMRVSTPCDGISKAHTIVYTLPRVWFSSDRKILDSMEMFIMYVKNLDGQLDKKNPLHLDSIEKIKQIMSNLQPILRAN